MSTSHRVEFVAAALRAIWGRKVIVAAIALCVCAAVVLLQSLRGHEYASEAVIQVRGLESVEASGGWLPEVSKELDSGSLAQRAADRAGWSGAQEDFERSLDLDSSTSGELRVGFSAPNTEMAAKGANAYAEAFVQEIQNLNGERLAGGSFGIEAGMERYASAPQSPASHPFLLGLAALAPGLAAGGGAALALARRDRNWRDAEFAVGAPVLGVIPELEASGQSEERS